MSDPLGKGGGIATGTRVMPEQKPGRSIQNYATPPEFIDAVKKRFSITEFAYDLAAEPENTKAKHFFCEEEDSLAQDWTKLNGDLWLNPPYARIAPWAKKCAESAPTDLRIERGLTDPIRRIFFLVPADVGSNWFAEYVDGKALVLLLNGRISFDGIAPYPKDSILAVYGETPGYAVWRWR